jgi:hypothetical protein
LPDVLKGEPLPATDQVRNLLVGARDLEVIQHLCRLHILATLLLFPSESVLTFLDQCRNLGLKLRVSSVFLA